MSGLIEGLTTSNGERLQERKRLTVVSLLRYCCGSRSDVLLIGNFEAQGTVMLKRRLASLLIVVIVIVVFGVIPAASTVPATVPCDCFYYPNHLRAFRESKAVFIGEVTKVERRPEVPDDLTHVTQAITFKEIKTWKGPKGQVRTWEEGLHTLCVDWKFEEG